MDVANLSTGDVLEATAIPKGKLLRWCHQKLVVPLCGGEVQGHHRMFTVMQTLGIAVAWKTMNTEHGCCEAYVRQIVTAFENMSENALRDEFEVGRTHLVMIHQGRVILGAKQYDWVDVQATHAEVVENIKQISLRYKNAAFGRPRGLAKTR